ncbi:MAG: PEGA domain-containing protein [Vicinamibacterales bacterium]
MTFRPVVVLLALQVGVVPAFAQRDGGVPRWPTREREAAPAPAPRGGGQQGVGQGARAREREPQPRAAEPAQRGGDERNARQRDRNDRTPQSAQRGSGRENDRRESDNGRRDRDGAGSRVAIPRQGPPPRVVVRPSRPNTYVVRPPVYRYTPRFNRPYVYGSLGPGYFYYGSFGWYPRSTYLYDRGYFGRGYGYDSGEVRLRVEPRWAEVYVDGFFAGTVDDFDGTFQSLKLESGPYHVEIVAPGFETLEVDLRISPGQKITYRGEMRPEF